MRRIAILNQKGGVGKTTTAVNLAAALARLGRNVAVLDLDPQAHASTHLGCDPGDDQPTMYDVLVRQTPLAEVARRVGENLTVAPADINLAAAEVELAGVVGREVILREAMELFSPFRPSFSPPSLLGKGAGGLGGIQNDLTPQPPSLRGKGEQEEEFDFLLLDCAPSLGVLTLNALAAADEVFIPLQPHYLALHGFGKLLETTSLVSRRINPNLRVTGIVVCQYDANTKLAGEVLNDLRAYLDRSRDVAVPWADARVFDTKIRRNVKLAEAPSHGQSIFDYAPSSAGAADYAALATEVMRPADWESESPRTTGAGDVSYESITTVA
jgi:chromosome partitioning protein